MKYGDLNFILEMELCVVLWKVKMIKFCRLCHNTPGQLQLESPPGYVSMVHILQGPQDSARSNW